MKRLVETNRWQDKWFMSISPNAKILLSYLYDNCDEAGFIDYNPIIILAQIKYKNKEELIAAFTELQQVLITDKKNNPNPNTRKIFIKDFLKHQQKLPVTLQTESGRWIFDKLKNNLVKFGDVPEIKNLIQSTLPPTASFVKDVKKKKKAEEAEKKELKFPHNSEEFIKTWENFVSYRMEIGKPYKGNLSKQGQLNKLSKYDEKTAIAMMVQTLESGGHIGIRELDEKNVQRLNGNSPSKQTATLNIMAVSHALGQDDDDDDN